MILTTPMCFFTTVKAASSNLSSRSGCSKANYHYHTHSAYLPSRVHRPDRADPHCTGSMVKPVTPEFVRAVVMRLSIQPCNSRRDSLCSIAVDILLPFKSSLPVLP